MKSLKLLLLITVAIAAVSCSRDPKVQAQRYVDNGNRFFDKAKYKEASIMYRRALQKDLRFGEAYYRLGLAELKVAAFGDAARALRRAVELQPKNADAAARLADIYMAASTQDTAAAVQLRKEAHDIANQLLENDSNSYDGHRLAGQLELLEKDASKAITELSTAYRIKPSPPLALAYFQAFLGNKQVAEAQKLAREVIAADKEFAPMYDVLYIQYANERNGMEAENILKLKVENNPKDPGPLLQLCAHYYATKNDMELQASLKRLTGFPDGYMMAGNFFFLQARDFERARVQYEAGARTFPKNKLEYEKRLVELMAASGKNPEASQMLKGILAENPKDADAIAMRAALQLQTGSREEINQATNDLQSLVTKTPDNHLLRYNLARALVAKDETDQARLNLEAAIKSRPDFLQARLLLARLYLVKGDFARALKESDDALTLNRRDLQAHLIRSSSLLAMGTKDKAQQELDVIEQIAPGNADARFQTGYLALDSKDYKRAEQMFGDLYRNNPKDLRALLGFAETLATQGKMGDAIQHVNGAIGRDPQRQDLKLALGSLYVRGARFDEAIGIYKKLAESSPKSGELMYRLAETQRRKGDVNTAVESFQRASQLAPNDPRPLLQLGMLMDGTGRREQAKPYYEQILKIQPDHPVALNNLAFIKAEEGTDLDEALTMAQKARQKLPSSPFIRDTLGWIYIKKNLSDDAVRTLRELIVEEPNNPSFRYHYGMALLQKGDKPSARRELEAAIRNNPSREDLTKIRELLAAN